jgi:hypothetical protein
MTDPFEHEGRGASQRAFRDSASEIAVSHSARNISPILSKQEDSTAPPFNVTVCKTPTMISKQQDLVAPQLSKRRMTPGKSSSPRNRVAFGRDNKRSEAHARLRQALRSAASTQKSTKGSSTRLPTQTIALAAATVQDSLMTDPFEHEGCGTARRAFRDSASEIAISHSARNVPPIISKQEDSAAPPLSENSMPPGKSSSPRNRVTFGRDNKRTEAHARLRQALRSAASTQKSTKGSSTRLPTQPIALVTATVKDRIMSDPFHHEGFGAARRAFRDSASALAISHSAYMPEAAPHPLPATRPYAGTSSENRAPSIHVQEQPKRRSKPRVWRENHPPSALAGATLQEPPPVANENALRRPWSPAVIESPIQPTRCDVHHNADRPSGTTLMDSPPSPPRKHKTFDTETETTESPSQKRTRRGIHGFSPPCLKALGDPFHSAPTNFSINAKRMLPENPAFSPPCIKPFVDPFNSVPTTVRIVNRRARSTKERPDAPRKSNVRTVPSVVASGVQKSRRTNGTPLIESTGKQTGNRMGLPKRQVNPLHVDLGEHSSVTDSRVAQNDRNKLLCAASRQSTAEIRARNMATASDLFPPVDDVFIVDQFGRRVRKTLKPKRKAFQVYRDQTAV